MSLPDVIANALALDFVNTANRWPDPERDLLRTPDGVLTWVAAALPDLRLARHDIDGDLLRDAAELRAAVRRVFAAVAAGAAPPHDAVGSVLAAHAEGVAHASIVVTGDTARLEWRPHPRRVLWAVADSAVELLRNGPLHRVGVCPSCGWLFLDTSRNGRRRWCSMATCGSRSKARQYYRRHARDEQEGQAT